MVSPVDRLKRVTDLFSEGTEVFLGMDGDKPIVLWVQKLNSFETEEARRDAQSRRSAVMAAMDDESQQIRGIRAEMALWDARQLAEAYVSLKNDELYLEAYNDVLTEPEMRELTERVNRLPAQLADRPADDPERAALAKDQETWIRTLTGAHQKKIKDAVEDALDRDRPDLERAFLESWRQRETTDVFVEERRLTQLYYALRVCDAVDTSTSVGTHSWDHAGCDHTQRLVAERSEIKRLPESVLAKAIDAIDGVTVTPREAGNSDAPASSSASSEQSSAAEAASTPSTQGETPSAVPTS